jgi:hypothetical protein
VVKVCALDRDDRLRALLRHADTPPQPDGIIIDTGSLPFGQAFCVPQPGRLVLSPGLDDNEAGRVALAHGMELAWLTTVLPPVVAGLLAARAGALYAASLGVRASHFALGGEFDAGGLAAHWQGLRPYQPGAPAWFDPAWVTLTRALWPLAAPLRHLLTCGGDERLALHRADRLNKYACAPAPQPDLTWYSSTTASPISPHAAAEADALRRRMLANAVTRPVEAVLAEETGRIAARILAHYQIADLAEAILVPSGTDATLLLMGMLAAETPGLPLVSVLACPAETGSGVPAAANAQHFGAVTASGRPTVRGESLTGFPPGMATLSVGLRSADGQPRSPSDLDAAFGAALDHAASSGRAVLHLIEGSKTGLHAPGIACAEKAQALHPDRVEIVVDACQARLSAARLQGFLARGWPVLLTGSKFFGGPAFSGVLLFPRCRHPARLQAALPCGLDDYTGAGAGLILRWSAALTEMDRFAALPDAEITLRMQALGRLIGRHMAASPHIVAFDPPNPPDEGWSGHRSVFPFALRGTSGRLLTQDELQPVYRALSRDLRPETGDPVAGRRFMIGQPVQLCPSIGALRLSIGARLLTDDVPAETHESDLRDLFAKLDLLRVLAEPLVDAAD